MSLHLLRLFSRLLSHTSFPLPRGPLLQRECQGCQITHYSTTYVVGTYRKTNKNGQHCSGLIAHLLPIFSWQPCSFTHERKRAYIFSSSPPLEHLPQAIGRRNLLLLCCVCAMPCHAMRGREDSPPPPASELFFVYLRGRAQRSSILYLRLPRGPYLQNQGVQQRWLKL